MDQLVYDVFISYARGGASESFADDVYRRLSGTTNYGGDPARLFMDRDMPPGGFFPNSLAQAIDQSRRFLALITKDYFTRGFCAWELQHAFRRDPDGSARLVVPLIIEPGAELSIPPEYRGINYLKSTSADWFERTCLGLGLEDPNTALLKRESNRETVKPSRRVLTRDGFLVVKGLYFARIARCDVEFWLSRTPVTVAEYRGFVGPDGMPPAPPWNRNWAYPDHPVTQINWKQAVEFCRFLGGRLPTFSEMQIACDLPPRDSGEIAVPCTPPPQLQSPVRITGLRSESDPNRLAVYDLTGNAWQWCADRGPAANDRWICGGVTMLQKCSISKTRRFPALGFRCLIEN